MVQLMKLSELTAGQQADCFALLAGREKSRTRDGKPFYRVTFRDKVTGLISMIWHDSPFFAECEQNWQEGIFYKLRCACVDSSFGLQLELERLRPVTSVDEEQGFSPADFIPHSRFDLSELWQELLGIVNEEITHPGLKALVSTILEMHGDDLRRYPASQWHHRVYVGGLLEHLVSVAKTGSWLARHFTEIAPPEAPPLSRSLVIAGAILHDIGKLRELKPDFTQTTYTASGRLIGHVFQGRDLIRDVAVNISNLEAETLLRLEHIILTHQQLSADGAPVKPQTPEALLVSYLNELDTQFQMMQAAYGEAETIDEEFTSNRNPLRSPLFRGLHEPPKKNQPPDVTAEAD